MARSALLFSVDSVSALLFSFVSLALIAQNYGPSMYGRYSVAQSVSGLFVIVVTLGLEPFIIRETARRNSAVNLMLPVISVMGCGWIVYAILVLAVYFVKGTLSLDWPIVSAVLATTFFVKVPYLRLYLQATGNGLPIAVGAIASRVVAAVFLFVAVSKGAEFSVALLYLPLQAAVCASVIYFMSFRKSDLSLETVADWSGIVVLIKESFPYFMSTAIFYAYTQADILFLSSYSGDAKVGVYSAAAKLIPLVGFVSFSLVAAYYPEMERALRAGESVFWEKVEEIAEVIVTVAILGTILAWLLAGPILGLMFGEKFSAAVTYFKLLSLVWVFSLPAALYSRVVIMLGASKVELYKMLLVGPASVLLTWFLIKEYDALGAAASVVISYAIVDLLVYSVFSETRRLCSTGLMVIYRVIRDPFGSAARSTKLMVSRRK